MKKIWRTANGLLILVVLLLNTFVPTMTQTVSAATKELTNVLTNLEVYNKADNKLMTGPYTFTQNVPYKFKLDFDLAAYDQNLADGDYFDFIIPAPFTVQAEQFELNEPGITEPLADVEILSNGASQGGRARVTLKNMEAYAREKGQQSAEQVKGTFYLEVSAANIQDTTTLPLQGIANTPSITFTVKERVNNKVGVNGEVLWKGGGVIRQTPQPVVSTALGQTITIDHPWNIAINRASMDLPEYTLVDDVSEEGSPMQFIPETFVLREGTFGQGNRIMKATRTYTFQELIDSGMLVFENSYTKFTLKIDNIGTRQFQLGYSTTAPNDGSIVTNTAMAYSQGQVLKPQDNARTNVASASARSALLSGGSISSIDPSSSIVIYKVDADDVTKRLAGAEFRITNASGYDQTFTTDDLGRIYTGDLQHGIYTIEEVKAPKGYSLPANATKTVTVNANGVVRTFKNTKVPTEEVTLEATKILNGKALVDDAFSFELINNADGTTVETVKNKADGTVSFSPLEFTTPGVYTYTIREQQGSEPGIAYTNKQVVATIAVTDIGGGDLAAVVSYSDTTEFTNTYTAAPGTASLVATKVLNGKALEADAFEFELVDVATGRVVETVTNNAQGQVNFTPIAYDKTGVHTYTIREKAGNLAGVTYSNKEVTATVTVTDQNAQLVAEVQYSDTAEFVNMYKPTPSSAVLSATKVLNGKTLVANQFEFELVDVATDHVLQTVANDAQGQVNFAAIDYDQAGIYTYKIREKAGNVAGVTYSNKEVTATVTVTDQNAQLVTDVQYSDTTEFVNKYEAAPGNAMLSATKVLNGKALVANQFEFELVNDATGQVIQTVANDAQGRVNFAAIPYTETGVHTYTIREKSDNVAGVTYSTKTVKATVTVTDQNAQLVADVQYSDTTEFVNTYVAAPGSAVLNATKVLDGKALVANQFEFELVDATSGDVLQTVANDAQGQVNFVAIAYDQAGVYTYKIREKAGNIAGVTYSNKEVTATVTVTDQNAQLVAAVQYSEIPNFTNVYTPAPGSVVLEATKVLTGKALVANEFEFELVDQATGNVLQTVANDAQGQVNFATIAYNAAGVYNYIIREKAGNIAGVTYSTKEVPVKVTVTDQNAQLLAEVTYEQEARFTNTYTAAPSSAVLSVQKNLVGQTLAAGQFEFELVDKATGAILQTASNNVDGRVDFTAIPYTQTGVYTYTIREKKGTLAGVTYSDKELTATVTVTDQNAQLVAAVAYSDTVEFTNVYTVAPGSVVLSATKVLNGRGLQAGEFEFELVDKAAGNVLETVKNGANGEVHFAPIAYDAAGVHTYVIREKAGSLNRVTYSTKQVEATVTVKDQNAQWTAEVNYSENPEFTNVYTPTPSTAVLGGTTVLNGGSLQPGQFTFDVFDSQGNLVETVRNTADGKVTFSPMTYNAPGVYTYTIRERVDGVEGIKYSDRVITATVTVTDNNGELIATVDYSETPHFINEMKPTKVVTDNVKKVVEEVKKAVEKALPNTGTTNTVIFTVAGAVVLVVGLFLVFAPKKRKNKAK